jgi:hypothetical protein
MNANFFAVCQLKCVMVIQIIYVLYCGIYFPPIFSYILWLPNRYFSILEHGVPPDSGTCEGALKNFSQLCSNRSIHSKTYLSFPLALSSTSIRLTWTIITCRFLAWTAKFAVLFTKSFTLPKGVTPSDLVDLFCRIKSNSLGFPFNKDETMGWCLDVRASMFNHSCVPNCCIFLLTTVPLQKKLNYFTVCRYNQWQRWNSSS